MPYCSLAQQPIFETKPHNQILNLCGLLVNLWHSLFKQLTTRALLACYNWRTPASVLRLTIKAEDLFYTSAYPVAQSKPVCCQLRSESRGCNVMYCDDCLICLHVWNFIFSVCTFLEWSCLGCQVNGRFGAQRDGLFDWLQLYSIPTHQINEPIHSITSPSAAEYYSNSG